MLTRECISSPARAARACLIVTMLGSCREHTAPVARGEREATASIATPVAPSASLVPARRPQQQPMPTTRKYMQSHYADSQRMRQAVVAGKLTEVQSAAAAVANDTWTPRLRGDYQPYVEALRAAARSSQAATSIPSAAKGLGKLGETCVACHLKFGGPGSPVAPVQLGGEGADAAMAAHALATERLWDGLITPSETAWLAGVRGLTDAPSLDSELKEVAEAAMHLRQLALQGSSAEPARRSEIFSSVLSTCAACHEHLGINVEAAAAP
jgi:hypothetical protein